MREEREGKKEKNGRAGGKSDEKREREIERGKRREEVGERRKRDPPDKETTMRYKSRCRGRLLSSSVICARDLATAQHGGKKTDDQSSSSLSFSLSLSLCPKGEVEKGHDSPLRTYLRPFVPNMKLSALLSAMASAAELPCKGTPMARAKSTSNAASFSSLLYKS